jgi:vacuolar-type H+-ATPase subunit E/Vma4
MPGDVAHTLDKVLSELLNEVDGELETGHKEALERVRVVLQETKSEATKILEMGDRQADSVKRKVLGSAELQSRNDVLRTLEGASNEIFQEALKNLSKSSNQYTRALERLIEEGVNVIGTDAVVECNSRDKDSVGAIIKGMNHKDGTKLTLAEKSIKTIGGVVLHSKDLSTRFDDTFETRLERMRPQLRSEVVKLLSEGGNPLQ